MLKIGLLCILTPCALVELFFYQQFGIALAGGLYLFLSFQAEHSARRLAVQGLRYPASAPPRKRWNECEAEEKEIKVGPLGGGAARETYRPKSTALPPPKPPREEARRKERPRERARQVPPRAPSPTPPRPREPHELLGVPREAATRTIVRAFRRWIKQVHPDTAGSGKASAAQANAQARLITEAKNRLLEGRRNLRNANHKKAA